MSLDDASSDVIYLSSLALSANIGPDRWGRPRTQPLSLSVAIHLRDAALCPSPRPSYSSVTDSSGGLDASACAGALAEDIIAMCEKPSTKWDSAAVLAMGVALLAAHRTEGRARELRVTVSAPEAVPLAKEYAVEFIGYAQALGSQQTKSTGSRVKVRVRDLVIPAVIGTTQTEREAKQLVAADITIFERPSQVHFADYPMVFNKLSQNAEVSEYTTLEKFALELVKEICLWSDAIEKVSVRVAKPSTLTSENVTGVQICRPRSAFLTSA